ncbi:MAG: hypothetical protein ACREMX_12390 [Gemmatimonadales bacterium]
MSDGLGWVDWLGWAATAVFAGSYFCRGQAALRRTQALAAGLWIIYGAAIQAPPVVVANLLVAGLALYSSFQPRVERPADKAQAAPPLSP